MRVVVLADGRGSAAGYAGLVSALGHEAWTGIGSAPAMALVQEARPEVVLIALGLESPGLRAVVQRVRAAAERAVPIVLALAEDAWWLRAPPSAVLAPVVVVRRAGLTAQALEGALARLGVAAAPGTGRASSASRSVLNLDDAARQLEGPAGRTRLAPAEAAVLALLLSMPGDIVTHGELARAIWGDATVDRARMVALRTHLHEVRRKLAAVGAAAAVLAEPGRGYRLAMS